MYRHGNFENCVRCYNTDISFEEMQASAVALRDRIWDSFKVHFSKFQNKQGELAVDDVDAFVVDVLHEESRSERDYVIKNLFRLDVDNSGGVSYSELGNFLFKRHCGEMSLQREHRSGKISHGSERKITLSEFTGLINLAFAFLKVQIDQDIAGQIFGEVDKDKDGLITYVEYFQVIELYFCLPKGAGQEKPVESKPQGPERHSKLRKIIWERLKRLYDGYLQGRSLLNGDAELRALLLAITGDLSDNEILLISQGLDGLNYKSLQFQAFAERFIYLIAQVGLSRFAVNRQSSKRNLNVEQFIILFKSSFSFLKLNNFSNNILTKIFAKIDKNNDGFISYDEYLDWVKRFLAVEHYFGDEFYVPEDDWELNKEDPDPLPVPNINKPFTFDDYTFAKQVRARVWELLVPYDDDKNEQFSKNEIEKALVGLLHEKPDELRYVTQNVFRYDRNNDGEVSYHELTNFCTELHFGEMTIQRRHRKGLYSEGKKRIMSRQEFGITINELLKDIQLSAAEDLIDSWFKVIDLDQDGWISYEVYFQFLKYYFGGASIAALETVHIVPKGKVSNELNLTEDQIFLQKLKNLSLFQRFQRIIIDQLRDIFFRYDHNKNQVFEADEVRDILEKVFELDSGELSYFTLKYFSVNAESNGSLTFEELLALILSVYFVEIVFKRRSGANLKWSQVKISLADFIGFFTEQSFFIRVKPSRVDLQAIFKELDNDTDGFITFFQYAEFIKKYLGNGLDLSSSKYAAEQNGVSQQELAFVQAIWDELKKYFDRYDSGKKGHLKENELREFVIEILQETSERELNYVFWNLFRVDKDSNKELDFVQFAPFILNHAGEISLQRFHRTQTAGKNALASGEFYTVFSNAYSFLSTIPKEKAVIQTIFNRIREGKEEASYGAWLNWVHRALSSKYKK